MSRIPTAAALAALAGALSLAGCYEAPTQPGEKLLRLEVRSDSTPADSATLVRVAAIIPNEARSDRRTVEFTTSLGTFVDGGQATLSLTAIDSVAETYLRAPRFPGTARIRAKLGSEVREAMVVFDTAYPQRASVQAAAFTLKAGLANETTISALLRRSIGQVTPGVEVRFVATREDNQLEIGRFGIPNLSDRNNVVMVRYSAGPTEYRGVVRIRVFNASDGQLLGETSLLVTSP
jgi:hypothetical protein